MSGFAKVAFKGEYQGQAVVNVFHYRSTEWLPGQGNPFDDTLAFIDAIIAHQKASFLALMVNGYKLNTVEGVGYDDAYTIVTPSPLVRTVNEFGSAGAGSTNGAANCLIVGLRCGGQTQINGIGQSQRNRGYLALGPLLDSEVDEASHISGNVFTLASNFAQKLDDGITVILPAVTLTPVRIHEKWLNVGPLKTLIFRTYSDVLGYTVRRVVSFRRSRVPEA
jgi:hypothetical protein